MGGADARGVAAEGVDEVGLAVERMRPIDESQPKDDKQMNIEQKIRALAASYAQALKQRMDARVEEMKDDDKSHYLVYRILGIADEEGS